jgi:hypothetical protein
MPSDTIPTAYTREALTSNASEIDYGGETRAPPASAMGSGIFTNQGWTHAAYQRTIGYYPQAGWLNSLTPSQS